MWRIRRITETPRRQREASLGCHSGLCWKGKQHKFKSFSNPRSRLADESKLNLNLASDWAEELLVRYNRSFISRNQDAEYLGSEAEEPLGFHHLLQNVTLNTGCAVVLVHDAVLQVDVVYGQAHVVLPPIDDGYRVEFIHHF